jgi:Na+-driven multidrug efflux pump
MSTQSLGVTVVTALVALAGAEAVAAFGIGTRVTSLVVLPALGLARGTETAVGQNLGAGQPERAKRAVLASAGVTAGVLVLVSVAVYLNAAAIVGVFITGEEAASVIATGADYLRIVGLTYVFVGVFHVVQGAYRGSGSTRLAMVFGVVGLIILRVPPAYALVAWFDLGATGVWYGIAVANVLMVLLSGAYFLRGTWTDGVIDRDRPRRPTTTDD